MDRHCPPGVTTMKSVATSPARLDRAGKADRMTAHKATQNRRGRQTRLPAELHPHLSNAIQIDRTMWFPVVAWIVLFSASAFFAGATLGLDPRQISIQLSSLPAPQRFALGAIILTTLSLIGSSVWQAYSLARQNKLLRDRLRGLRQEALTAHDSQKHFDGAVQHLLDTDPEVAITSIQKTLSDTEQRVAEQRSRIESVDLNERLDEIRRRQQALREAVGAVSERRRVVEPVFGELKDRLRQLDRWLTQLEIDDNKQSLGDRVKELDHDVSAIHARENSLQQSLATLNRFKEELTKSDAELAPLRSPETGIYALIADLRLRRDALNNSLEQLESSDNEKLDSRVEALSREKIEIEQRVARLDDCFNILDSIRLDLDDLRERRAHLERSLAEVETDASGESLVDRQNALSEFIIRTRLRLEKLQDSSATLNQFKEELAKTLVGLAPLQGPVFGIEALIGEVNVGRDILARTLDDIEIRGDEFLSTRVEALAASKIEVDERVAKVFEDFQKLDSMRKNIGEIFTSIRGTLNRIG
jgi:chromosome segregation ATPase